MKNTQKKFAMRMAVLLLCLLVFASALSSCGYFTEQFLEEYAGDYTPYDPYDYLYLDDNKTDVTLRIPGETKPPWTIRPTTTKSPETTRTPVTTTPVTTRKPQTTKAPETTRKPQTTTPVTTRKPQTTVPETTGNIPSEFKDHVYLAMKNSGRCDELLGNVLVTVILVKDSESSWTSSEISDLKKEFVQHKKDLEASAAKYGKKLDISFTYINATYSGKISSGDSPEVWQEAVSKNAGFSSLNQAQAELDKSNDYDTNPIIFIVDKPGRPYASWNTSQNATERISLFDDAGAFKHELCHLFGAQDYYYPKDIEALATKHIPNSLMGNGDEIDALTAFCIGWDDKLDQNAYDFLAATSYVTWDYLNSENEKQQTTGNVTNFELSYGIYTGYLDRGVPSGKGSIKYNNGNSYDGYFVNGNLHGKGVFRWADGVVYDGDWVNGNKTGKGTMTWADGDVYTGDWVNNERTGKGVLIWANGDRYEGDFVNGNREGQGTYTGDSGSSYQGEWKNNQRHGYGKYTWAGGASYEGYWQNGNRHGYGKYISNTGKVTEGQWENDKFIS